MGWGCRKCGGEGLSGQNPGSDTRDHCLARNVALVTFGLGPCVTRHKVG